MEENKVEMGKDKVDEKEVIELNTPRNKWLISQREVTRTGLPGSWKYIGEDRIAMKHKLTEKQKAFTDEYLVSHNASAAFRASKWTLPYPELWSDWDRGNGNRMKRQEKIVAYLKEKIFTDAAECLDIQMEMIRDEKTPAAVRNNAIIDRLNRIGVWKQKEESNEFQGVWEVTITIKHKKPEIIEVQPQEEDDLDIIDEDNGETSESS